MNYFEFESDDAFYIWSRGFVFHGKVITGKIKENDKIVIKTKTGDLYAKVNLITKLSTRKLITESIVGERIAILLNEFSNQELNNIHKKFNPDTDKEPDTTDFLNVEYPIKIMKKKKETIGGLIKDWLK